MDCFVAPLLAMTSSIIMAGHSCPKDGVASTRLCPAIHVFLHTRSPSVKRAHLDRRPAGDGGLAPPRQRLVQACCFQHPKAADVLLGLQIRSVGDEYLTI